MNYRNTRVYSRSLELVRHTQLIMSELPNGYGFLADQLRRAVSSIVLNFSEGCGKSSIADRKRFFQIARASAYEVAAAFDVGHALGVVSPDALEHGIELCDHVSAMLTRFGGLR